MSAVADSPALTLRLRERTVRISGDPLLMGIVNASPDSFSDPGRRTVEGLVQRARQLASAGAALIDVGASRGGPIPPSCRRTRRLLVSSR